MVFGDGLLQGCVMEILESGKRVVELTSGTDVDALVDRIGCDRLGMVHHSQQMDLFKPLRPNARLRVTGRVARLYDLKRLAISVFSNPPFRSPAGSSRRSAATVPRVVTSTISTPSATMLIDQP